MPPAAAWRRSGWRPGRRSDDAGPVPSALAAVMTIAGALAPTLRALRVDPITALAIGMSVMDLYGLLLRLYPASFRNEYGSEMRAVFERRRAQTSAAGAPSLWLGAIGETVVKCRGGPRRYPPSGPVARRTHAEADARLCPVTAIVIVALRHRRRRPRRSRSPISSCLRPLPFARARSARKHVGTDAAATATICRLPTSAIGRTTRRCSSAAAMMHDRHRDAGRRRRSGTRGRLVALTRGDADARRVADHGTRVHGVGRRAGSAGTVILSYALWQAQFGGDPSVPADARSSLSDEPYTVIGVMGREFRYPSTTVMRSGFRYGSARSD
mgnify:CR=1 FL=1